MEKVRPRRPQVLLRPKAAVKNRDEGSKKTAAIRRMKSGAPHQISRRSKPGNHQDFLAHNAGSRRITTVFL